MPSMTPVGSGGGSGGVPGVGVPIAPAVGPGSVVPPSAAPLPTPPAGERMFAVWDGTVLANAPRANGANGTNAQNSLVISFVAYHTSELSMYVPFDQAPSLLSSDACSLAHSPMYRCKDWPNQLTVSAAISIADLFNDTNQPEITLRLQAKPPSQNAAKVLASLLASHSFRAVGVCIPL